MSDETRVPQKRSASARDYQRAYKACIPCRNRKARCDLGDRDGPPCVRCRREQRECIFSAERAWASKRQKTDGSPVYGQADGGYEDTSFRRDTSSGLSNGVTSPSQVQQRSPGWSRSSHVNSPFSRNVGHTTNHGIADSVIRTVVSSGNDALQILWEAAAQSDSTSPVDVVARMAGNSTTHSGQSIPQLVRGHSNAHVAMNDHSKKAEALRAWNASRFVKMGLFTAEEAIMLVDRFFETLFPMTPILTNYYADLATHRQLLTSEPLLCTTILMISSRYHALPGASGSSRGFLIHDRLWQHCQHLIKKIMFGLEKGASPKTRTLGSIEALLLLSEWHPRSLHFPSEIDGWDADLIVTAGGEGTSDNDDSPATRWLEEVTEPARRSDQMSWMLIGCAITLAHELNLFEDENKAQDNGQDSHSPQKRGARMVKVLYIFSTQIASRLGYTSMFPHNRSHPMPNRKSKNVDDWDSFILAWTELTRFIKSSSEMVFPSQTFTKQLLQSGRYVGLLEHFRPLLEEWRRSYLQDGNSLRDLLFIDYQYVRVFCNSIGMQAVCERALANSGSDMELRDGFITSESTDYTYIQEVIDGSCEILQKVIALSQRDALRYAPVRVFLRITTSSIFLLKAVSLGVRTSQLQTALDLLQRSIEVIRSSAPDDMHLASPYATLLEMHVTRLRRRFSAVTKQTVPTRPNSRGIMGSMHNGGDQRMNPQNGALMEYQPNIDDQYAQRYMNGMNGSMQGYSADDWLSLPFDPSMAPFGEDILDNNALDFLWNSPA